MKTYQIHMIRHALTDGNLRGQYIGRTDLPLCPEGVGQLAELRDSYTYPTGDFYYTSPLLRCTQTLHALYPAAEPTVVPGLAECDFGSWEGKTAAQLKNDSVFASWIANGGTGAPPGGESSADFARRCCAAFADIVEQMMRSGVQSAVIVAHGGSISSILAAFGLPRAHLFDWMMGNCQGYSVRITPSLWMRGQVCEVYETLPIGLTPRMDGDQRILIDIARDVAHKTMPRNGTGE